MANRSKATGHYKILLLCLSLFVLVAIGWWANNLYTQSQKKHPAAVIQDPTKQILDTWSLRQQITSLLILHVPGRNPDNFIEFLTKYQPAGLILMSDNLSQSLKDTQQLTQTIQETSNQFPYYIAIDQEGCTVKRLPQDTFPCASNLKDRPFSETAQAFTQRSQLLRKAGINMNFGIVADISSDPESFIYPRVFGGSPTTVSQHVAAATQGSIDHVLVTLKHFPGHGATTQDSHHAIPRVNTTLKAWQKHEALPFKAGIDANAQVIMFSHLTYHNIDSLPASLSPKWHEILTQDLNFSGLTVTDDLIMLQQSKQPQYQDISNNVIQAIQAGNDLVLLVNNHNPAQAPHTVIDLEILLDDIEQAINDGKLSKQDIYRAAYKNLRWRANLPQF